MLFNLTLELFLGWFFNPIELQHRDILSNVLMGFNETDNITSTIGLTTNTNKWPTSCEPPCHPSQGQAVEMPWPDWYEQYSNSILNDSDSRAAWKRVITCFDHNEIDQPSCIRQHGNEKVVKVQGWAKEWSLGCVNPASWLPVAVGHKFTQPRDHSFAQPCTYNN